MMLVAAVQDFDDRYRADTCVMTTQTMPRSQSSVSEGLVPTASQRLDLLGGWDIWTRRAMPRPRRPEPSIASRAARYWPGVTVTAPRRRAISLSAKQLYSLVSHSACSPPRAWPRPTRCACPLMDASSRIFSQGSPRCSQMRRAAGTSTKRSLSSRARSHDRVLIRRGSSTVDDRRPHGRRVAVPEARTQRRVDGRLPSLTSSAQYPRGSTSPHHRASIRPPRAAVACQRCLPVTTPTQRPRRC